MDEPFRITSRQNPRVKQAARLREGRERQRTGRFILDGAREIFRALQAGIVPIEAFICDSPVDSYECRQAVQQIEQSPAEIMSVSPDVFAKLAYGERNDGIVVVAETPQRELNQLALPQHPLVAVLEGVEKPGNVGAVLRSADAAGVDAVIVVDGVTDLFNPNTIRASLGTVFRPNVCTATIAETIAWLRERALPIYATRLDAKLLYSAVDLRSSAAIVLGSEAHGLSNTWRTADIMPIRLPMHGIADSLNVSATAAVLFYEALRQRAGQQ
jgi:TrmH family RNA methyltransferase